MQLNGRTVVRTRPVRTVPLTTAQAATLSTFKKASAYARMILQNEDMKMFYSRFLKPGLTPYNLAVSDYFKRPVIGDVNVSGYTGNVGDMISIHATDNFKVAAVKVRIENGGMIEEGEAAQQEGSGFVFIVNEMNDHLSGTKIIVTAQDLTGNSSVKEIKL